MSKSIGGELAPLSQLDPKIILARYLTNETSKSIAESLGVTVQALSQYLIKNAEDDWKDCQIARAIARRDQALDDLDKARLDLQAETLDRATRELYLARVKVAEAQLKSCQWDLERTYRRLYGQDQPSAGVNAVQININLRGQGATNAVQHENNGPVTIEGDAK